MMCWEKVDKNMGSLKMYNKLDLLAEHLQLKLSLCVATWEQCTGQKLLCTDSYHIDITYIAWF